MPKTTKLISAELWFRQATYFSVAAGLCSQHSDEQIEAGATSSLEEQKSVEHFRHVTVGVFHAFAIEAHIKGIMVAKGLNVDSGHDHSKLLNSKGLEAEKAKIQAKYNCDYEGFGSNEDFDDLVSIGAKHFVKLRYFPEWLMEEDDPVSNNMDFSSFLISQLAHILATYISKLRTLSSE